MFLDQVFPETLNLTLTQRPFPQSQDDTWGIRDLVFVDYDLFVGLGGAARFSWGGVDYLVEAQTALLVPPRQPLRAQKVSAEPFQAVAQHFELKHLVTKDFFDEFRWTPWVRFPRWPLVETLLDGYVGASTAEGPGASLVAHALFRTLVLEFARVAWIADQPAQDPHHGFVFRMARDLEQGMRNDQAVAEVLAQVPCSADYACRLFKKQFGLSPVRYWVRCRIRAAADLLMTGATVKEAALAVGYEDPLYFSRVFTKLQGLSPKAFQARQGMKT